MPTRALVVDDEPAIRELLSEYLRGRGVTVDIAGDGESAIARLGREPYDLVVSDLKLPGVDGVEVVRAATSQGVPAVIMTGFGTVETATAAFEAGARDYLQKPFRLRDLWVALEAALGAAARDRRRAWSEAALELLVRAEAESPDATEAESLVVELEALLRAAPGVESVRVLADRGPDAEPLGGGRWITVEPRLPTARPIVRAVHAALVRAGR